MDIKKQVCSIEQATRLKELGIDQTKSYFYYYLGNTAINMDRLLTRVYGSDGTGQLDASAFTVAELGVMLGKTALKDHPSDGELNEAIDRADDLICLLEYEEYLPEEVNERLAS